MKNFWDKLVSESSEVSSKRFISLIVVVILGIGFIADLFWDYKVEESSFNSLETIVEIGMGAIVAEKFSNIRSEKKEKLEEPEVIEKPEVREKPVILDKPLPKDLTQGDEIDLKL